MAGNEEKIKELEKLISETKYNKRTQAAIGLYKAQLAKLKAKEETRGKGTHGGDGYSVRKSGDATVVLLGFPSVGKSSLLNVLTNADSPIGAYAFTTLTVIPGSMHYKGAEIQILDVPGIVHGASTGSGRGKEVLQVLRNADLILIIIDVFHPEHLAAIEKEVYNAHVRMNKRLPDVRIKKTVRGGIHIGTTVPLPDLDKETAIRILREFKISNAHVLIRTPINADQLIDVIEGNKVYVPSIRVLNKVDMIDKTLLKEISRNLKPDLCISAAEKINIEELKEVIFNAMDFIRIYCKEVGKKADIEEPMIMRKGDTVETMCRKLHKDFVDKFKFVKIWGPSAKFPGQRLSLGHPLQDEDIVELHIR
jgi:uncharacterized protein